MVKFSDMSLHPSIAQVVKAASLGRAACSQLRRRAGALSARAWPDSREATEGRRRFVVPTRWEARRGKSRSGDGHPPSQQVRRVVSCLPAWDEKSAVTKALEEFIARRQQKKLLDLFDSLEWDPEYDYKSERSRG